MPPRRQQEHAASQVHGDCAFAVPLSLRRGRDSVTLSLGLLRLTSQSVEAISLLLRWSRQAPPGGHTTAGRRRQAELGAPRGNAVPGPSRRRGLRRRPRESRECWDNTADRPGHGRGLEAGAEARGRRIRPRARRAQMRSEVPAGADGPEELDRRGRATKKPRVADQVRRRPRRRRGRGAARALEVVAVEGLYTPLPHGRLARPRITRGATRRPFGASLPRRAKPVTTYRED